MLAALGQQLDDTFFPRRVRGASAKRHKKKVSLVTCALLFNIKRLLGTLRRDTFFCVWSRPNAHFGPKNLSLLCFAHAR